MIFAIEIVAVIAFVALGCNFIMGGGGTGSFNMDPVWQPENVTPSFLAAGISIAALNFLGFDGISTLAEETHEPEKNIGNGIMIALVIIIVCFCAQTYIASLIQPDWASWSEEHANNAFFYGCQLIGGNIFMNIMLVINIIAVGIANIMNAQLAASRLLYSMGRDGVIPRIFGKVHPKYQTPWVGSLFIGGIAFVLVAILGMADLATLVNFGALFSFTVLNFAVFWYFFVKEKQRGVKAVLRYVVAPWIGIVILVYVFTGFEALTYTVGVDLVHHRHDCGRCEVQGLQRSARRVQESGRLGKCSGGLTAVGTTRRCGALSHGSAVLANSGTARRCGALWPPVLALTPFPRVQSTLGRASGQLRAPQVCPSLTRPDLLWVRTFSR